ncbi:IS66 family transposase [Dictyobacter arantiisoli]|uniref:IS66 family transposase n=1 Tax=Dictyobacter arantiisoli TaxID=2014874 RepID=UPI00155A28FE|nr:IS66 family transposase [Dictyobacter arantiisoli]
MISLRQENKALRELLAIRDEQLSQMQQQMTELLKQVQALQARLSKDSHNSHLPPSSDRFQRQPKSLRKKSEKKAGGQPGHDGNTLSLSKHPDQTIRYQVQQCEHCRYDLRRMACVQEERRQVIDLPPKRLVVIEHQTEQKCCPRCQRITATTFPEDVRAPVQYGPALGAVAVYLVQQQLLPYERACETLQDLMGPAMTVGTLKALVDRCAANLQPIEVQIKDHLRQAKVMHQDETGLYVMGKRHWMHVAATAALTHYAVHPKRGAEAVDAIGILNGFRGVSVHDGWATYWKYACEHALCNVHHLRELTFVFEEQHQAWAGEMKRLLLAMNEAVKEAQQHGLRQLHPSELADWKARYHAVLQAGEQANPLDPPPKEEAIKRGRRKQSTARNLLDRLSKHQDAVLLFLENFAVPFDNSRAERDIRMVKVQQKVSGCFRSSLGAEAFCRIRGYISTLHKQGAHVLTALELAGHPVSPAF